MKRGIFQRRYLGDAAVLVLLAAVIVLSVFLLRRPSEGASVRVTVDGKEAAVLPLSKDVEDYCPDGHVHIRVKDGRAFVFSSDCPDHVCMAMRGVDKNGGGAVCLPNKVVLEPVRQSGGADYVAG